jgi:hypothetical protein
MLRRFEGSAWGARVLQLPQILFDMSTMERRHSSLWLPVEYVFSAALIGILIYPSLVAVNLLVSSPLSTLNIATIAFLTTIVTTPLFVAGYLDVSTLWGYVLVYMITAYALVLLLLAAKSVGDVALFAPKERRFVLPMIGHLGATLSVFVLGVDI